MSGAFGSFEAQKDFGIKRYDMVGACMDAGTISHAWTERCVLDYMTRLCSDQKGYVATYLHNEMSPKLDFLSNHVAKFKSAYVEQPHDVLCLKMERVKGLELNDYLAQAANGLSDERSVKISCELIQTLATLHECGIAHRDLKLDNVMVKADGTPVLIDWGTANIGENTKESKVICGTRRANSIQQLAVEAFIDGNLNPALKTLLFQRKKPSYDMKANDCVQLAHILSALWTSCTTKGEIICGAFGPNWDEAAEGQSASLLALMLQEVYADLKSNPVYELFPAPFAAVIWQLAHPNEDERFTPMEAWRQLWNAHVLTGPRSRKVFDLRSYLDKPPTTQFMDQCKTKLLQIAESGKFTSTQELSARELFLRWECQGLVALPECVSISSLPSSFLSTKCGSPDSCDDASTVASLGDCKLSLKSPRKKVNEKKRGRNVNVADASPKKKRRGVKRLACAFINAL